ncbi:MAG: isoprenylcysteine carboxylmethyltransferase family protein [Ferruginibacter sp.]
MAAIVGLIIIITALLSLNKNISPFPSPRQQAVLITSGPFKLIRHPIYTGILMFTCGVGLYTENITRLIIFLLLLLLFNLKARYEEILLVKKFPAYTDYKKHTGMFLPKFYK